MRDYRTISAAEFLEECIEMKLRWLAQLLRRVDKPAEIEAWASSVTAVTNLLWKIKDQPWIGHGQAARGKLCRKDGRRADATKLVKDKAHMCRTDRTERCDINDTNRTEEDETVVVEHDGEDVKDKTTEVEMMLKPVDPPPRVKIETEPVAQPQR